jgi:hypothetical protein
VIDHAQGQCEQRQPEKACRQIHTIVAGINRNFSREKDGANNSTSYLMRRGFLLLVFPKRSIHTYARLKLLRGYGDAKKYRGKLRLPPGRPSSRRPIHWATAQHVDVKVEN